MKKIPRRIATALALGLALQSCEVNEPKETPAAIQSIPTSSSPEVKSIVKTLNVAPKKISGTSRRFKTSPTIKGEQNEFDENLGALVTKFSTRDWTLYPNDVKDIRAFASESKGNFFVVQGQSDYRGEAGNNEVIARNRAESIITHLKSMRENKNKKFYTVETGESLATPGMTSARLNSGDRVALLFQSSPISAGLKQLKARHYLIESSNNMSINIGNNSAWNQVQEHPFEPNAEVHVFSRESITSEKLSEHTPTGQSAPTLTALHELIEKAKRGESITVVTTKDSSSLPEHNYASVIRAAKRKGIVISVIGVNLSGAHKAGMLAVARETRGKHFFIEEHK